MIGKRILIFNLILILPLLLFGQRSDSLLVKNFTLDQPYKKYTGLHRFYKRFLSSQDGNVCTFSPSCSSYMKESMRLNGWLIGLFLGVDRLTRCNGSHHEFYRWNRATQKPEDKAHSL